MKVLFDWLMVPHHALIAGFLAGLASGLMVKFTDATVKFTRLLNEHNELRGWSARNRMGDE